MPARTPTVIQLLGLAVTLVAVVAYSLFTLGQLDGLRRLGSDIVDRNRRDSLQLIRIQNDLSQIGLALRDITEGAVPYPMEAFKPEFDRIKGDLEDALRVESGLMPSAQTSAQRSISKLKSNGCAATVIMHCSSGQFFWVSGARHPCGRRAHGARRCRPRFQTRCGLRS